MKKVRALATGVVWTFEDSLADSLLGREDEFVEVRDEPKPVKAAVKPSLKK